LSWPKSYCNKTKKKIASNSFEYDVEV
jgi:hypothetical protein